MHWRLDALLCWFSSTRRRTSWKPLVKKFQVNEELDKIAFELADIRQSLIGYSLYGGDGDEQKQKIEELNKREQRILKQYGYVLRQYLAPYAALSLKKAPHKCSQEDHMRWYASGIIATRGASGGDR